ncbi:MAG: hypothetical protein WAM42_01535 [Candidatus Nitrosopolaris sp.]
MSEHGDYDVGSRRWYCSYWQTSEEWEDIHDYDPSDPSRETINDTFKGNKAEKHE